VHEVIAFLKGAIFRSPNAGIMGCYSVSRTSISARKDGLQAGVALESAAEFNVPAEEFEAALGRMREIQSLAYSGQDLTIKSGRLKATIQCVDGEPPALPAMPEVWKPAPPSLVPALKLAAPFLGEQGWSAGVRLMDGRVTAIKNTAGIDIAVPGLELEPSLLPAEAAAFVIEQGAPESYVREGGSLMFLWSDGRWARCQLLAAEMPEVVEKILDGAGEEAPIEITSEWREAFADAAALSDGVVSFAPNRLFSGRGAGRGVVEIETAGLPADFVSHWQVPVLEPVLACAARWNPAAYPRPALFVGEGLRGVVIGIRR
jgi:hypothetical protein